MPQSERTVILFYGPEEWHLLEIEAARLGTTVRDLVARQSHDLLGALKVAAALEHTHPMTLPGRVADEMGGEAVKAAAERFGLKIKVEGGTRHDGKEFG